MNYRLISKTLGKYLLYFSLVLCVPLGISLYYQFMASPDRHPQPHSSLEFFETILITLALSFIFQFFGKKKTDSLMRKESILLVVLIWIVSACVGALPFYLTKTLENPIDAYFETMSGFTTTGASCMYPKAYDSRGKEIQIALTNPHVPEKSYRFYGTIKPVRDPKSNKILYSGIEAVSKGILFWRSFIQWLGGMGIVVLFLAILPALAVGGKYLYQMEVPGPTKDILVPRIKETASILWKLYLTFTIIEIYLLIWTNPNMPLFDAFCITFSNLSTGGFTVTNTSIGAYKNVNTEWVVLIFMFIGSSNFALYFQLIRRKLYRIYEPDFLFFLITTFSGAIIVILSIMGHQQYLLTGGKGVIYTASSAIRDGAFQAISAQTSTGFSTTNYDMWPFAPQLVMLMLMFIGGMSGSTAGGIKTSRIYILAKIITHKIKAIFRPEDVKKLKIGKQEINIKTATTVLTFFAIVMLFTIIGTVALTFNGIDPESSVAIIICMLNNIGMSFRAAGPSGSFAFLSGFAKIVSSFWMLLGRLEFFAVLLLLVPSFWRRPR